MSTDTAEQETAQVESPEQEEVLSDDGPLSQANREYIDQINRRAMPADKKEPEAEPEEEEEVEAKEEKPETGEEKPEAEEEEKPGDWITGPVVELAAAIGVDEATLREHFPEAEDFQRFLVIKQLTSKKSASEPEHAASPEDAEAARVAAQKTTTQVQQEKQPAPGAIEDIFPFGERVEIPPPLDVEEYGEAIAKSDRSLRERLRRSELIQCQMIQRLEWGLEQIVAQQEERLDGLLDRLDRQELYGKSSGEASDEQKARRKAVSEAFFNLKDAKLSLDSIRKASNATHTNELLQQIRKEVSSKVKKQSARRTRAGGAHPAKKSVKPRQEGTARLTAENAAKLDRLYDELGRPGDLED